MRVFLLSLLYINGNIFFTLDRDRVFSFIEKSLKTVSKLLGFSMGTAFLIPALKCFFTCLQYFPILVSSRLLQNTSAVDWLSSRIQSFFTVWPDQLKAKYLLPP